MYGEEYACGQPFGLRSAGLKKKKYTKNFAQWLV